MRQKPTTSLKKHVKETILIVDDNHTNLETLVKIFSKRGYKVQIAPNGNLALKTIQLTPPNLILLEIRMPKIDGYEVCSQLKASPHTKDIPIIFISALNEAFYKVKAFEIGGVDYITKPFQEQEVLARVENQLRVSRLMQQLTQKNIKLSQEIEQRRKAEALLRKSEESYGAIVESQTEIIVRFMPDRTITFVNEAYCRYFGQSQLELIGKIYQPLIFPDDQEKVTQLFNSLDLNNPVGTIESRVVVAGEVRWMQWNNRAIFDEWGCLVEFQVVGRDITERKQVEAELAQNAQQSALRSDIGFALSQQRDLSTMLSRCTEAFVQHLHVAFARIWTLNPDENMLELQASAGMYTHINGDHARVPVGSFKIGRIASERQPHLTNDVLNDPRLSDPEWAQREGMVAFAGYPLIVEERLVGVLAMFARQPLNEYTLDTLAGVANEIAVGIERKKAQEALLVVQKRLEFLLASNPSVIFSFKANVPYRTTFISENISTIFGYEPREFMEDANFWANHIHPEDTEHIFAEIPQLFAKGYHSCEYRFLHQDGIYRWVYQPCKLVRDQEGNPLEIVSSISDITQRKQLETALQESQRWLWAINEANPNILYVYDLIKQRAIYTNREISRVLGYTPEEIQQMERNALFLLMHPDDMAIVRSNQKRLKRSTKAGQIIDSEYRMRHKNGEWRWLFVRQVVFTRCTDGKPKQILTAAVDISDRKHAEEKLRISEAKLAAAQRVAHVGNWEFDTLTQKFTWSEQLFRIFGINPTQPEPTYDGLIKLIYPDDRALFRQTLKQAMIEGKSYHFDLRLVRPSGEIRHIETRGKAVVNEQGQVIKLFGTVLDITDRKQIEEALRRSETQLREAQAIAHIGSWDYDILTQKTTWSEELFRIHGLDPLSSSIPTDSEQYIHPDDRDEFLLLIEQAITLKAGFKDDIRIIRVDGEIRHVEIRGQSIFNEQGQIFRLVGSCMDITELKNLEAQRQAKACELEQTLAQLKRTQAHLIQSEKMSALGQMVAGVAHEINNPVSFIYCNINPANGYVKDLLKLIELYQRHCPEPVSEIAEQIECIDPDFIAEDFPKLLLSIKEGAERISQIVLCLRNFSRLDEAERKRVDIHQGLDNTLLILQHRLKQQSRRPQIQVVKEYDELQKVMCYPGLINQVFMNILSNAIDAIDEVDWSYTSEEPTIWIRTELREDSKLKRDDAGTNLSRICICIANNGSPINPDVLPKIFDPFFTTKPVGSGMGLGLSIGYQIVVEKHGGRLSCNVSDAQKIEFVIELPA